MILAKKYYIPLLFAAALHCGTYRPGVRALPVAQATNITEAQLFKPASAELIVLNTGEVEVDDSLLLDLENHPEIKNSKQYVPCSPTLSGTRQKGTS